MCEFLRGQFRKARIIKGGRIGVGGDILHQWLMGDECADAAAQLALLFQGDEGGAQRLQGFGVIAWIDGQRLMMVQAMLDRGTGKIEQNATFPGRQGGCRRSSEHDGISVRMTDQAEVSVQQVGTIADDLITRACGIAGIAQINGVDMQALTPRCP